MSLHLFSTPVECTHCHTVVDDPKVDRCPNCGELLKERRRPSRLAGVEKRYANLRFLLGTLRFLGVVIAVVGILAFFFTLGDPTVPLTARLTFLLGSVLVAVGIFTVVALFDVALDVEENTRATFRIQQMMLEAQEEWRERPASGSDREAERVEQ